MTQESEMKAEETQGLDSLRQALAEREARLAQVETALKDREQLLEAKTQFVQELESQLAESRQKAGQAAVKYRSLLLANSPEVPEELVQGEMVEEVEASFARARQVVERVKRGLEARLQGERVPAGAPPRMGLDLSGLSPTEKIAYGLARR